MRETRMLGQFWYREVAPAVDVSLDLKWFDGEARGKVFVPCPVATQDFGIDLRAQKNDEYLSLPLALSYGLLIAAASGTKFTVTGDPSAWPQQWGTLLEGQLREFRVPAPISH